MHDRAHFQIEERLITDTLSEYMDSVDTRRDLWPGIHDRLSQPRRTRIPVLARLAVVGAVVSLVAMLAIVRPWSLSDYYMSPFAAVAHAYEGLYELETVRYRVDGTNSSGQEFVELHQVDMVNRIEYWLSRQFLARRNSSGPKANTTYGATPRQLSLLLPETGTLDRPTQQVRVGRSFRIRSGTRRRGTPGHPSGNSEVFPGVVRPPKILSTRSSWLEMPKSTAIPSSTTGPIGGLNTRLGAIYLLWCARYAGNQ